MRAHFVLVTPSATLVERLRSVLIPAVARAPGLAGDITVAAMGALPEAEMAVSKLCFAHPEDAVVCIIDEAAANGAGQDFSDRLTLEYAQFHAAALVVAPFLPAEALSRAITGVLGKILARVRPPRRPAPGEFLLRRLRARHELHAALCLRYEVYGPAGMSFMPPALHNAAGFEVDAYDKYAIHFGCWRKAEDAPSGERLVAGIRLITRAFQPATALALRRLLQDVGDPVPLREFERAPAASFPVEESYDGGDRRGRVLGTAPDLLGEVSRLIVGPAYRGLDLARATMEFALAWARVLGLRQVVQTCHPKHVTMNRTYGFRQVTLDPRRMRTQSRVLEDASIFICEAVHDAACILMTDPRRLPPPTDAHVGRMVAHLAKDGEDCVYRLAESPAARLYA